MPKLGYPGHYETCKVDLNGLIKWKAVLVFLSHTLVGETVTFEEIDDRIGSFYYGSVLLARFDERDRMFHG